ncbi:MAG TPA: hypothetical protein VMZ29_15725 [Candidatus Bathyarchaeia archaeon]|nr:hypothetical protein [Candidatus Bathyarchaeia archaeon]
MIPIVVTPNQLYDLMMHPKFDVFCSYLLNQSVIRLFAPSQIYRELEGMYATYGTRGAFSHKPKPQAKHLQLMENLKRIITLEPVIDNNEKYKKYQEMASYVELCDKMQAFGIWNESLFRYKFDIMYNSTKVYGIPYLPTAEIIQFLGKDMDYLINRS